MCCDVGVEPALQPLDREPLQYATANSEDCAGLDVIARVFGGQNRQCVFFNVQVFNPFACSYSHLPFSRHYHVQEQEKCRAYDEWIREVERVCFSLLVFGGMGPAATTLYRKLASAEKWNINYNHCLIVLGEVSSVFLTFKVRCDVFKRSSVS